MTKFNDGFSDHETLTKVELQPSNQNLVQIPIDPIQQFRRDVSH